MLEKFLKVDEAADVLNVSRATVYRLIHDKELRGVKVGRSVRVRAADLEAYVQVHLTQ